MAARGVSDQIMIDDQTLQIAPRGDVLRSRQEVTWQHVERLITRLNRDSRLSLKTGGYVVHSYSSANHF